MAVTEKRAPKRRTREVEFVSLAEYVERAMRRARVTKDETGYTATVPLLRGCISCGDTKQEALNNLLDAIEAWVLTGLRFGDHIPPIGNAVLAYAADEKHS